MPYIRKIFTLITVRGLSLLGFFLLAFAMDGENFKEYALYFATWQIAAQITGLQIGVTLFRHGITPQYRNESETISSILIRIAPLLYLAYSISILAKISTLILCIEISLIYSIFSCISEFARTQTKESDIFAMQGIVGASYLAVFIAAKIFDINFTFKAVAFIECSAYFLAILIISTKILANPISNNRKLRDSLITLLPLWKKTSLPLIPNNLIWYLYFNSPQIISYYLSNTAGEHKEQAILFRIIVAASTFSSILALALQKNLVQLYETSYFVYEERKKKTLYIHIPLIVMACVMASIFINLTYSIIPIPLSYEIFLSYLSQYLTIISLLSALFLAIYVSSNFIIAEKKMSLATKSMVYGLIIYIAAICISIKIINLEASILYSLSAALIVTLISRYTFLLWRKN
ncbi:hypothetical protein [Pseudomonas citronellolis]|uniref:hypothetical protein n=1 Tax=Pseudomonas citronellolis TaxID=53408 RepID=UPI00389A7CF1